MKKLAIGVGVVMVVAAVAVYLLIGNLDKILKGAIESIGTELLGVPVTVAAVELDVKTGSGQISGFTIANPAGYQAPEAFRMEKIRLGIDIRSLGRQPFIINELVIQNPEVEVEVKEDGSSNLQTLLKNIEQNSARADQKAATEHPPEDGAGQKDPVRMSFKKMEISGVKVHGIVPGQEPVQVVLPDIIREDVGGSEGITPSEVGGIIIGDIIAKSLQQVVEKKLSEKIGEAATGLFQELKKKIE